MPYLLSEQGLHVILLGRGLPDPAALLNGTGVSQGRLARELLRDQSRVFADTIHVTREPTMKKPAILLTSVLSLLLFASAAGADGLFYLAGKVGTTDVNADVEESFNLILDGDDEGQALGLGFKFGDHVAFELAYHDFGTVPGFASQCPECLALTAPLEGDTTAISFTFLPHLKITDSFLAYGKVGVISWETSLSALEENLDDYTDEDIVYGIGLRYLLPGPLGVFAEIERFADSFETVSLGATLGF